MGDSGNLVGGVVFLFWFFIFWVFLIGLGVVGWGIFFYIRCVSFLLVFKMLGKEGRFFVLGYVLVVIYEGECVFLGFS